MAKLQIMICACNFHIVLLINDDDVLNTNMNHSIIIYTCVNSLYFRYFSLFSVIENSSNTKRESYVRYVNVCLRLLIEQIIRTI